MTKFEMAKAVALHNAEIRRNATGIEIDVERYTKRLMQGMTARELQMVINTFNR